MGDAPPSGAWWVERYHGGPEAELLELFERVFGASRTSAHWDWKFRRDPYGGPFVSIARRRSDGRVIGSLGAVALPLNLRGRHIPAALAVDAAVLPEHRGQRVFEKVAADCHAACASAGVEVVVGFPNPIARAGLERLAGWALIAELTSFRLRLSIARGLRGPQAVRILLRPLDLVYRAAMAARLDLRRSWLARYAGPGLAFRSAGAVPDGYQRLWSAWKNQEVLSVWKDSAYFEWRYDRHPDHRFTYYWLEREGELAALAVGAEIDGALALCELVVRDREVAVGRRLVTEIAHAALARGLRAVNFLGHDAGLFDEVFAGFERTRSFTNVFGGRVLQPGPLAEDLPHPANWTVTFGDGDFV